MGPIHDLLSESISESIYNIETGGLESEGMLIACINHGDREYQVQILVTSNQSDFIEEADDTTILRYSDGIIYE